MNINKNIHSYIIYFNVMVTYTTSQKFTNPFTIVLGIISLLLTFEIYKINGKVVKIYAVPKLLTGSVF